MLIANVDRADIMSALEAVNARYEGNLDFADGVNHVSGRRFRCRLRAISSRGPGARRSWSGRRTVAACWHAYGYFFDALPEGARITVAGGHDGRRTLSPGDRWVDFNVGSLYSPAYMSELCECE